VPIAFELDYTLTGVIANFFTVAGATTVTHSANSGVIRAVFPVNCKGNPINHLYRSSRYYLWAKPIFPLCDLNLNFDR